MFVAGSHVPVGAAHQCKILPSPIPTAATLHRSQQPMSKLSRARTSRRDTALPQEVGRPLLAKTRSSTRPSLRGPRKRRCPSMKTAYRHLERRLLVQARPLQQKRCHHLGTPSMVAPGTRRRQTNRALHRKSAEKTLWQLRGSDTSPESERRQAREQRYACLYLADLLLSCAQMQGQPFV